MTFPPTEEGYPDTPCNAPGCPRLNDRGEGKGEVAPECVSCGLGCSVKTPISTNVETDQKAEIRTFETGANRDTDTDKLDYEGFLSPIVLQRFAEYMHKNRKLKDGSYRDSDNWQKMFGESHKNVCMKSLVRHTMDLWLIHRGHPARSDEEEACCAIMFNAMAYLLKCLSPDT